MALCSLLCFSPWLSLKFFIIDFYSFNIVFLRKKYFCTEVVRYSLSFMGLYIYFLPRFGKFSAIISLNKLIASFSIFSFCNAHYSNIAFPNRVGWFSRNFFIYKKNQVLFPLLPVSFLDFYLQAN